MESPTVAGAGALWSLALWTSHACLKREWERSVVYYLTVLPKDCSKTAGFRLPALWLIPLLIAGPHQAASPFLSPIIRPLRGTRSSATELHSPLLPVSRKQPTSVASARRCSGNGRCSS